MVVRDDFYELVRDYMEAKGEKNFTRMITTLVLEGIQYDENKGRKEIAKELRDINRRLDGINERMDVFITVNRGPNK